MRFHFGSLLFGVAADDVEDGVCGLLLLLLLLFMRRCCGIRPAESMTLALKLLSCCWREDIVTGGCCNRQLGIGIAIGDRDVLSPVVGSVTI